MNQYREPLSQDAAWLLGGGQVAAPKPAQPKPVRTTRRVAPVRASEPDLPPAPLPPGALDRWLDGSGSRTEPEQDAVAAATTARDQAHALLGRSLRELAGIAANRDTETGDRIAAIREMSRIADTLQHGSKASVQRSVAEVEADLAAELRALGWQVTPPGVATAPAAKNGEGGLAASSVDVGAGQPDEKL